MKLFKFELGEILNEKPVRHVNLERASYLEEVGEMPILRDGL